MLAATLPARRNSTVEAAISPCFTTIQPLFNLQTGAVCYPISPSLANKSGFRSYSNFNRVFTQRMGKTVITWMQDGK